MENKTEAEKLTEENTVMKGLLEDKRKLVEEHEDLKKREVMGGKADLTPPPEPKKKLTPKEYSDIVRTGIIPQED